MWERFKVPHIDGMNGWMTEDGERSYVISFDTKHPTLGYCFSVRRLGGHSAIHQKPGLATLKDAKSEARRYMRQAAN